jgi:hypothetical protein
VSGENGRSASDMHNSDCNDDGCSTFGVRNSDCNEDGHSASGVRANCYEDGKPTSLVLKSLQEDIV